MEDVPWILPQGMGKKSGWEEERLIETIIGYMKAFGEPDPKKVLELPMSTFLIIAEKLGEEAKREQKELNKIKRR